MTLPTIIIAPHRFEGVKEYSAVAKVQLYKSACDSFIIYYLIFLWEGHDSDFRGGYNPLFTFGTRPFGSDTSLPLSSPSRKENA